MVVCSLFSSLIAICAWISIPIGDIAFTLQTFAIFLALGAVGLPVFSGFQGGIGTLLGVTGGYLWGFLLSGLGCWALERVNKPIAMGAGLLLCYACGSCWFLVYAGSGIGLWFVLLKCVVPYLIPDGIKLALALSMSERLKKHIK